MKKKRKGEPTDAAPEEATHSEQRDESAEHEKPEQEPEQKTAAEPEASKTAEQHEGRKFLLKQRLMERWRRMQRLYMARPRLSIPLTVVAVLLLLAAVPLSRYTLVGVIARQDMTVTVVDSRTSTPVSKASVVLSGQKAMTDATGRARIHTNVGYETLSITKRYYQDYAQTQLVDLAAANNYVTVKLVAVGRLVPVAVTNKLTGKPVAGATVKALSSEAVTDKDGTATVVLPVSLTTQQVVISAKGFNSMNGTLQVTDRKVDANTFAVVPAGKLYFLSNQSGKIDVVKTDLDGSSRQTVLAGTGYENSYSTALLASRDWKYLALYAQRTAKGSPEIDLIDTSNDQMTNIDEGDASFALVGWEGDKFVYRVDRNSVPVWQNGQQVIKSFDAPTKKLATLAQTSASGSQYDYARQYFGGVYILGDKVVYSLNWTAYYYSFYQLTSKQATLNSVNLDGSGSTVIKSFAMASGTQTSDVGINIVPYDEPDSIAVSFPDGQKNDFYEYKDGKISAATDVTAQNFYSGYPTFLLSPSGNSVFWSVYADGKNNLKIGDSSAQNPQVIAGQSDYSPYGWFTDDYLLMQKSNSELYIISSDGKSQPFKVTNYYKPDISYRGYGGGYGGL